MPILMVFLISCNGLIGYLIGITLTEVLKLAGVEKYFGNRDYFVRRMTFNLVNIVHGVSYPIALLYFSTKLRKKWKKQYTRTRSNRVRKLPK